MRITIAHAMREVAIVGAGELGGALAHVLARRDVARDDPPRSTTTGRVAAGKALDITQAAPIEGFATRVVGLDRPRRARPAPASSSSPIAPAAASGRATTALTAAAAHRASSRRGASSSAPARRSASSSSAASASCTSPRRGCSARRPRRSPPALRALVALEADGVAARRRADRPRRSAAAHRRSPWEDATVGGFALTRVLDEPARRRLAARGRARCGRRAPTRWRRPRRRSIEAIARRIAPAR